MSNVLSCTDNRRNAPTLLFVHGVLTNRLVWQHQADHFAATHRVVCVDMRGFGLSAGTGQETFLEHATAIRDLIDHLALKDATYVGWSMGGAVGQVFSHAFPDRLQRAVLVDTTPQLVADENFAMALDPASISKLGELFTSDYDAGCETFAATCAPEDPEVAGFLAGIMKETDRTVGLGALASGGAQNQLSILADIMTNTHVICGDRDNVCRPEASAFLAKAIPGCIFPPHIIASAGHAPFLTKPDQFNAILENILDLAPL